jgi:hypothetical protein
VTLVILEIYQETEERGVKRPGRGVEAAFWIGAGVSEVLGGAHSFRSSHDLGNLLNRCWQTSQKRTSGQLHVSLAENHRSIQCPPSDNFRFARHPPTTGNR